MVESRPHSLEGEATLKKAMLSWGGVEAVEGDGEQEESNLSEESSMCKVLLPGLYLIYQVLISLLYSRSENQRILVSDRPEFEFPFQQLLSIWTWRQVT